MNFPKDHERFSKLTSGIQNLLISIAVLVGGGWTLYSFQATKTAQKAAMEAELLGIRRAVIDVDVTAEAVSSYVSEFKAGERLVSRHFLLVSVVLKNLGNERAFVSLKDGDLTVDRLGAAQLGQDGNTYSGPRDPVFPNEFDNTVGLMLLPGAKQTLRYASPLSFPGLYNVRFSVPAPPDHSNVIETRYGSSSGEKPKNEARWFGSTIVNVNQLPKLSRTMKVIVARVDNCESKWLNNTVCSHRVSVMPDR